MSLKQLQELLPLGVSESNAQSVSPRRKNDPDNFPSVKLEKENDSSLKEISLENEDEECNSLQKIQFTCDISVNSVVIKEPNSKDNKCQDMASISQMEENESCSNDNSEKYVATVNNNLADSQESVASRGRVSPKKFNKNDVANMKEEPKGSGSTVKDPGQNRLCRRENCHSFRLLFRRQMWVNSVRMAAALRKLFRTRRSTHAGNELPKEVFEPQPKASPEKVLEGVVPSPSKKLFSFQETSSKGKIVPLGESSSHQAQASLQPSSSSLGNYDDSPLENKQNSSQLKNAFSCILKNSNPSVVLQEPNPKHRKLVRTKRLMKEFQELTRYQTLTKNPVFSVDLINDCLFEWKVKLFRIDSESELWRDMVEFNIPYILLSLSFPDGFPFQPPFLRVLAPRLEKGFVMEGGAICMELLTPRGWASAYTIEAVIMQFAASLVKGQGRVSRRHRNSKEFNKKSAEMSFKSLVKTHEKYGWVTPPLAEG